MNLKKVGLSMFVNRREESKVSTFLKTAQPNTQERNTEG